MLEIVNLPTRCATGPFWYGAERFRDSPAEFDAIHFHRTDMIDAGWRTSLRAVLPHHLPSGLYGLQVTTSKETDTVPFVVMPRRAAPRAPILVLLPTFTYLAYANESLFLGMDPEATGASGVVTAADEAHVGNATFGLCFYDRHPDGAGVSLSSSARPILNMRHDYKM